MSKTEVENEGFDERPILLVVVVLNDVNLEFLKFFKKLAYFV